MRALLEKPRGRFVVVGAGKQGVAAGRLLRRLGAWCVFADDGARDAVRARLAAAGLGDTPSTTIAECRAELADVVVLSAGVPMVHPGLRAARERGVPFVSEIDLAWPHLPSDVRAVAITGTNGKSTTTTIAGAIAAGEDPNAFVGGNLGTPLCDAVVDGTPPKTVVLELSSYQLEVLSVPRFRAVAVTNLSPDHLDRYPNVEAYFDAKARILSLLDVDGGSVLNRRDEPSQAHFRHTPRGRAFDFDVHRGEEGVAIEERRAHVVRGVARGEVSLESVHLVGRHNLQNAACAIALMHDAGSSLDACRRGIAAYAGIAHRLERVADHAGVVFVNDSKATNVDAAIKAVMSFERGVHLIAGGRGKGASYAPLVEASRGRVARVYTIGEDARAIGEAYDGACEVVACVDLMRAFRAATEAARAGDVVLLAPACASFDQWKNYEERGQAFASMAKAFARSGGTR